MELLKKQERKWTNIILIIITIVIIGYVAYIKGWIPIGSGQSVVLQSSQELFKINSKESPFIGVNKKQVFQVTRDGIIAYELDGEECWQDTFSFNNFVVMQKEPYIAVGSKGGQSIHVFNDKGKQYEITSPYPIVYFSINEKGGVVTIANDDTSYIVSAYNELGKNLCNRTTFIRNDGYPLVAELSPDNKKLIMSYSSVDEPQVISRVYCMDVNESNDEVLDNIEYGREQNGNLVYEIEFINNDTWVSIGDKLIVWYDIEGNELGKQQNLSVVFVPYLYTMNQYGLGYIPMIISEKPTQNIVHRQDELAYFNHLGEKTVSIKLGGGAESIYADGDGVVIQLGNTFTGYDKLGNTIFEYIADTDVNKVIYVPSIKKGIAINKESVLLLTPKRGGE